MAKLVGDEGPQGKPGDKGKDGDPNADGNDGKDGMVPDVENTNYGVLNAIDFLNKITDAMNGG